MTHLLVLKFLATRIQLRPCRRSREPSVRFALQMTAAASPDRMRSTRAIGAAAQSARPGDDRAAGSLTIVHRDLHHRPLRLAIEYPAIYGSRIFAEAGGLVSYAPDLLELIRQAVSYGDRILRGEKPSELPVQAATKFELVINLTTARALGLDVPLLLQAARRRGDRMMKRREFITLIGGAAAPGRVTARAQQTGRVWRVAVIGAVPPLPEMLSAFREALQQRGWAEGKNLSIDVRWPKGSFAQEPGLISEVLHSNVDVIVAWATPSALAARRATSTIPIVFLGHLRPGLVWTCGEFYTPRRQRHGQQQRRPRN